MAINKRINTRNLQNICFQNPLTKNLLRIRAFNPLISSLIKMYWLANIQTPNIMPGTIPAKTPPRITKVAKILIHKYDQNNFRPTL